MTIGMVLSGKASASCTMASLPDNELLLAIGGRHRIALWFTCWIHHATFGRRLPLQAGLVALPFHHRA
jgi:hypothetical protein